MNEGANSPAHYRRRPRRIPSGPRRPDLIEATFGVALVAGMVALAVLAPAGHWAPAGQVAVVLVVASLASGVSFQVRDGWCSPMQVAQVPLWVSVPPAALAPLVACTLVLGAVWARVRTEHLRREPAWYAVGAAGDAWHALGAAVVLAAVGVPAVATAAVATYVLVFAGQVAADALYSVLHGRWALRMKPADALRSTVWVAAIDAALLPIGFLAAYALHWSPWIALSIVPTVVLFAEFARERDARLSQALELSSAYRGTAQLMATVLQDDHQYTGGAHTQGVVDLSVEVGEELGLDGPAMHELEFGALLHDIGKLHVPNEILNKPGALSDAEWEVVRRHPADGQEMLDRVGGTLETAGLIVRAHHERFDGSGYPDGLVGKAIPFAARIITACDAYNAMTTDRAYRSAMSISAAVAELEAGSGSQFDPEVVSALLRVLVLRGELRPRARGGRWSRAAARDVSTSTA